MAEKLDDKELVSFKEMMIAIQFRLMLLLNYS